MLCSCYGKESMWEKLLCRHRVSEVGGGCGDVWVKADNPLQSMGRTVVTQAVTPQPREDSHWSREVCPEDSCHPWRAHAGAGFLAKRGPCWSSLLLKDCTLCKGLTLQEFIWNSRLWERLTLEKFVKDCLLHMEPYAGGQEHEQQTQCIRNWSQTPFSIPSSPLRDRN